MFHKNRFTTDANHKNLMGRIRTVSYQYVDHGFIEDGKGNMYFESNTVEELIESSDKYPCICIDYKVKKYSDSYEPSKKLERSSPFRITTILKM